MFTEYYKKIQIQEHNNEKDKDRIKAQKQWKYLDKLIEKYSNIDISDVTSSSFNDSVWEPPLGHETNAFHFKKYVNGASELPMQVYLKILAIHLVRYEQVSLSSIKGFTSFLSGLYAIIRTSASPVMQARRGAPWLPLSELEPSDITYSLDQMLEVHADILRVTLVLNWIESTQADSELGYFVKGFITPWSHEGVSVKTWVQDFKKRHDLVKEEKPYSALSEETVSAIVANAMPFIEGIEVSPENGIRMSDIDFENPILSIANCIREIMTSSEVSQQNMPAHISKSQKFIELYECEKDVLERCWCSKDGFTINKPEAYTDQTIMGDWFTRFFGHIQNAAIWIVALTTGLRNSDIRSLKFDCLHYSKRYEIWFIKAALQKTKNTIYIPVGVPSVRAIKLLNWLRASDDDDVLIQNRTIDFNPWATRKRTDLKIKRGMTLNQKLQRFARHYNIRLDTIAEGDEEGTCHSIRATLAGYIGRNSSIAILILKKLFGHSNGLMPDRYIRHNIYVQKKRKQQLEAMHSEVAHGIAKSIVDKEVAGTKGEELLKGTKYLAEKIRRENESLTEMDVHKKLTDVLKEIILNDIKNEQTQTLLTPMGVICMRASNHSADSPCAVTINKAERDKAGVSRAMFGALAQLPNPAQCIGLDCPDALATKTHSLPLLGQFDWYTNVLRQCTAENLDINEDAKHFLEVYYPIVMANDMLKEAESFRKKYSPALRKLYSDIKPEGYFDV